MGLVGLALLCLCGSAFATDYYVATDGDDGWPGTQAQPWATLQYAVDTIAPGDTILVRAGTHDGCHIYNSGQSGSPCTLKAYPGEGVVVQPGPSCIYGSPIEVEYDYYGEPARYWVIEGLEATGGVKYGIDLRNTEYITVRNCYVHHNGDVGIDFNNSHYATIEYNEVAYNLDMHGIYNSDNGDYATIRGNLLHHNAVCGLHMNGGEFFGDEVCRYALIEDNVIWDNAQVVNAPAVNFDGASDNVMRNNLIYGYHQNGISLFAINGAEGSSRNKIYNNTFAMAYGSRWCVNIFKSRGSTPDPADNVVMNNIMCHEGSDEYHWGGINIYGTAALAASDYNTAADRFRVNKTSMTFAEWQQNYGYDPNSFLASASELFVNPATNDYHLKAGSPAIDAGTTLAEVTDDMEGTARPQGDAYDIGCYEAASGPVPPVAQFSGNPTQGYVPLTVYYTDQSTGNPTSWSWTFGDSGTSPAQHPSHEYTAINTYDVSLTATNAQGQDTETKLDYIKVSEQPTQNCHVGAIDLVGKEKTTGAPSGRGYYAEATITVHDQDCAVLAGVTVDITWSGCVSGSDSGVTDETGQVMFTSAVNPAGGTFTCCVDDLTKTGYPYNSGANHETCDSIVNP